MIAVPYPPAFNVTTDDTSCAAPVDEAEYAYLVSRLDSIVVPALWEATLNLHAFGFMPMRVARQAGLASLVVQRDHPPADAWLYFQIHRSYGPMLASESIFWMYAIHHPAGTTAGRPGRLLNLEEPHVIGDIIAEFVQACAEAPTERRTPVPEHRKRAANWNAAVGA